MRSNQPREKTEYAPLAKEMEIYVLFTDVPYTAGFLGNSLSFHKRNIAFVHTLKYQVG